MSAASVGNSLLQLIIPVLDFLLYFWCKSMFVRIHKDLHNDTYTIEQKLCTAHFFSLASRASAIRVAIISPIVLLQNSASKAN